MEPTLAGAMPARHAINVLPFVPRKPPAAGLSMRDRIEVVDWQERARHLGYDRLVVHERSRFDPPELESFLSVYRAGAPWATWSLTRHGRHVLAWSGATGADRGPFATVSDALHALLVAG